MIYNRGFRFAKKMFTPTPGKIIFFAVLVFFIFMLPIYSVKVLDESLDSFGNSSSSEFYYSNEPLALVLLLDYEWVEINYACPSCGPFTEIHHSADPGFIPAYYFLFIFAYGFSCYLTERARWQWKGRFTPYIKSV